LNLIFHPRARPEYQEVIDRYRERGEGRRAEGFVRAVEESILEIIAFPEAYPLVYLELARRKRVSAYPYFLIYCVEPDAIGSVAVAHERPAPFYWLGRVVGDLL